MNEKFVQIKNKIKTHAPEIIAVATSVVLVVYAAKKSSDFLNQKTDFTPLNPRDIARREELIEEGTFDLYHLTGKGYVLDNH